MTLAFLKRRVKMKKEKKEVKKVAYKKPVLTKCKKLKDITGLMSVDFVSRSKG